VSKLATLKIFDFLEFFYSQRAQICSKETFQ